METALVVLAAALCNETAIVSWCLTGRFTWTFATSVCVSTFSSYSISNGDTGSELPHRYLCSAKHQATDAHQVLTRNQGLADWKCLCSTCGFHFCVTQDRFYLFFGFPTLEHLYVKQSVLLRRSKFSFKRHNHQSQLLVNMKCLVLPHLIYLLIAENPSILIR